jgi:hypothetical protein
MMDAKETTMRTLPRLFAPAAALLAAGLMLASSTPVPAQGIGGMGAAVSGALDRSGQAVGNAGTIYASPARSTGHRKVHKVKKHARHHKRVRVHRPLGGPHR